MTLACGAFRLSSTLSSVAHAGAVTGPGETLTLAQRLRFFIGFGIQRNGLDSSFLSGLRYPRIAGETTGATSPDCVKFLPPLPGSCGLFFHDIFHLLNLICEQVFRLRGLDAIPQHLLYVLYSLSIVGRFQLSTYPAPAVRQRPAYL